VAFYVDAWIESSLDLFKDAFTSVAFYVDAWIERFASPRTPWRRLSSRSMWMRGLKVLSIAVDNCVLRVASYADAWLKG
ncbi:hypothetical protein, partial [Paenibacillus aceti]|uniref:hypothetical protein n=1 Tax=Paenibacillus aceti TaxID=1820010 RepID=UPI0019696DF5